MTCAPENAAKFADWIANRGGVAVWNSINMSNPGASWSTPALTEEGQPYPKPTWQAESTPSQTITNAADIIVEVPKEVKRFHVAVERRGFSVKLTSGGTRKVKAAVAKAGDAAWYDFDYSTQEAVILVPETSVLLSDFIRSA